MHTNVFPFEWAQQLWISIGLLAVYFHFSQQFNGCYVTSAETEKQTQVTEQNY